MLQVPASLRDLMLSATTLFTNVQTKTTYLILPDHPPRFYISHSPSRANVHHLGRWGLGRAP